MLKQFFRSWDYTFVGFCTTEDSTVLSWSSLYISRFMDIQRVWRDPDNKENKKTQGLKDVAGAIIDKFYLNMKTGFGPKSIRCGPILLPCRQNICNMLPRMHMQPIRVIED
jgi:hypothetical protein